MRVHSMHFVLNSFFHSVLFMWIYLGVNKHFDVMILLQGASIKIAGYTQPIEQPFLMEADGEDCTCRIGDERLSLDDEKLQELGNEAAEITEALKTCTLNSLVCLQVPLYTHESKAGICVEAI
jgi:hypothetical protein